MCLLLLALAPWVASAYTSVDTEALFPEQQSWHAGRQGWFGGLTTHLTLFDEATAWLPTGEASLELDPGALVIAMAGYDVGPLRFGQEVAWHRAPLNAITSMGTESRVSGDIVQLKLLSRNRLALRLAPGSPHTAYVSLGLGAVQAEIEFEDRSTGLVYEDEHWTMVYEVLAGVVSRIANDDRLRIGIRATNAEPVNRVLFDALVQLQAPSQLASPRLRRRQHRRRGRDRRRLVHRLPAGRRRGLSDRRPHRPRNRLPLRRNAELHRPHARNQPPIQLLKPISRPAGQPKAEGGNGSGRGPISAMGRRRVTPARRLSRARHGWSRVRGCRRCAGAPG